MDERQRVEWKITDDGLRPFVGKQEIAWAPQDGSQMEFIGCPIDEVIYVGTRGPGKTDGLIMSFYMHVGKGYGAEWRGILFRRTYPELQDVIEKTRKWFGKMCPGAKYNATEHTWTFPDGEKLLLRHFLRTDDYWKYHGHAYPWIGWEELCTWSDDQGFKQMMSTVRSTVPGMPRMIRATANPYGPGHNWVKARYRLPVSAGRISGMVIRDDEGERVAIHGELRENKVLLHADPQYINRIRAAARNKAELRAWLYGDWNIVAGGMFDDVWDQNIHVVPNFPLELIPRGWPIDRSFDWGQSRPFSVGWWAQSNGERFKYNGHIYAPVPGDLIRIAEWYGCTGKPNEGLRMLAVDIAQGIIERQIEWGIQGRVRPGPADSSIFDDWEPGKSIAGDMSKRSVTWEEADKSPGSRIQGWEQIRKVMQAAKPNEDGPREEPGLFVAERCIDFQRTVPVMSRSNKNIDDVDTDCEDHIGDETRYRLRRKNRDIQSGSWK
jgi:hypothetical protein